MQFWSFVRINFLIYILCKKCFLSIYKKIFFKKKRNTQYTKWEKKKKKKYFTLLLALMLVIFYHHKTCHCQTFFWYLAQFKKVFTIFYYVIWWDMDKDIFFDKEGNFSCLWRGGRTKPLLEWDKVNFWLCWVENNIYSFPMPKPTSLLLG